MAEALTSVYDRRVANEWREALQLQACNTDVIRFTAPSIDGEATVITARLCHTTGLATSAVGLNVITEHTADFRFPRFYPAVPIEAYLRTPLFHPNVHPVNGFVCLWDRHSPGETIVTAAVYLQRIIAWGMCNAAADHVMQPGAVAWRDAGANGHRLPLEYRALKVPGRWNGLDVFPRNGLSFRRRLD